MKYICVVLVFWLHRSLCLFTEVQTRILNEISWPVKLQVLKGYETEPSMHRRVGMQAYRMEASKEQPSHTASKEIDESSMKIKLFRLMYETVRDNDLMVKRGEVIKTYYGNSTLFNLGYVMGEVTERFNVMKDIALTMKKLYGQWKPMEHINAYEQIANKAVELCNMVDVARSILKNSSVLIHKHSY